MNKEQLAALQARPQGRATISAAEIGGPDRTLALGQTPSRYAWHLYLETGWLHVLTYHFAGGGTIVEHHAGTVLATSDLTPGKLLRPESTDERFALLVRERGYDLDFEAFNARRYAHFAERAFHGPVVEAGTDRLVERTGPAVAPAAGPVGREFAFKVVATAVLHVRAATDHEARTVLDGLLHTPLALDHTTAGGHRITALVPADGWPEDVGDALVEPPHTAREPRGVSPAAGSTDGTRAKSGDPR
ncbi:hypothetical protein ACFRMQ_00105 [Kitasatospora sp. NPDC056783]|uniref:hypothetical protein n=1 Tax=Kitasatospora sp. NPDC056783 TaxID=3345943 RepID=UPI0036AF5360